MKKRLGISTVVFGILVFCCIFYSSTIVNFVMSNVVSFSKTPKPSDNDYSNGFDFEFVQITDNFHVEDRQDILNAIFTILNSGQDSYSFYCSSNYDDCLSDLKDISEDQTLLSVINNMVSPYNSYQKLYITTNSYGKATISLDKLYSEDDIVSINSKLNEVKAEIISDDMSERDKIMAFHDYLINNSIYDEKRAKAIENGNDVSEYDSHKANGPLLSGVSLCSGYSDAMKLFLDDLGIKNYKISNDNHIWNLVFLDNQWLHLDLTWDDPVTSDNSNVLLHKFFLVSSDELFKLDQSNHYFNTDYYLELA